ncbi:MAG TPA: PE domain-containing protein [Pseudonocardiaceae bacterium]
MADDSSTTDGSSDVTPDQLKAQIQQNQAQTAANAELAAMPGGGMFAIANTVGQLAGMGKGYQFSPEEIENQITQCGQQMDELRQHMRDANTAAQYFSVASAADPVSQKAAKAHTQWATDLATNLRHRTTELQQWMDQLNQAKKAYMDQEHLSEDQWHRLTLGLEA